MLHEILDDIENYIDDAEYAKAVDLAYEARTKAQKYLTKSLMFDCVDEYGRFAFAFLQEAESLKIKALSDFIDDCKNYEKLAESFLYEQDNPYGDYDAQVRKQYYTDKL